MATNFSPRLKIALMASILLAGLTLMINRAALADQDFVLDVEVVVNEEHQTKAHVSNRAGETTEIQIWKDYRLFILPTALDNGDVRLALQLQKYDGSEYVQVAGPRIVTPNGKPATVRSGWENGDSIVIEITPSIQDVN